MMMMMMTGTQFFLWAVVLQWDEHLLTCFVRDFRLERVLLLLDYWFWFEVCFIQGIVNCEGSVIILDLNLSLGLFRFLWIQSTIQ